MKKTKNFVKWFVLGLLCTILTIICVMTEQRIRWITGLGVFSAGFFVLAFMQLFDKNGDSTLVIEDIFRMNPNGCVVVGGVKGSMAVNQKVSVKSQDDVLLKTKINGIEVMGKPSSVAVNTHAALYFKEVEPEQLMIGATVVSE